MIWRDDLLSISMWIFFTMLFYMKFQMLNNLGPRLSHFSLHNWPDVFIGWQVWILQSHAVVTWFTEINVSGEMFYQVAFLALCNLSYLLLTLSQLFWNVLVLVSIQYNISISIYFWKEKSQIYHFICSLCTIFNQIYILNNLHIIASAL